MGTGMQSGLTVVLMLFGSAALALSPVTGPISGNDPLPVDPTGGGGGGIECLPYVTWTFSANPPNIKLGESTTLSWSVAIPAGCVGLGQVTVSGLPVGYRGSLVYSPLVAQSYVLKLGKATLGTVNVTVAIPQTVRIKGNHWEWAELLVKAVGTPGTTVLLAHDVDLDLSGYLPIPIAKGVTLTSEAPPAGNQTIAGLTGLDVGGPPAARSARDLGPRIYTRTKPQPLFRIDCSGDLVTLDSVRISGFRLQGPHFETEEGDDNLEKGIIVDSCLGVEISNMELSGWSGQAIGVADTRSRIFNPDAVKIHGNYIHHNQHKGGWGYGVNVGKGAYASIERNVFDFNRHAITSSGAPGVGYSARHNLVLKGGGVHGTFWNTFTQQFDVHGDQNCPDVPGNQHTWNCGAGGDQFWFDANAFQYTSDKAIKLRGVPRVEASITSNVFAHEEFSDAVEILQDLRVKIGIGGRPNVVDVDTFGEYGVCDFDGDGRDDLFLAAGASWWYASGGRMHWTFMNAYPQRLRQVGLGDFDGDGRCDVITQSGDKLYVSSGGTSSWSQLPGSYPQPFDQLRFADFTNDRITDIFYRESTGQWYIASPGRFAWRAIQRSSVPLEKLRLGDFNGDGVADVLGVVGDSWSVSWGGTSSWQRLNAKLADNVQSLLIANVDGIPGDDVVRFVDTSPVEGRWEASSGGTGAFKTLGTLQWPSSTVTLVLAPARHLRGFAGRFDDWAGSDILSIDLARTGYLYSKGRANFTPYNLYAY